MSKIRARSLTPIIGILRQFNLEPEEILSPFGFDINELNHPAYEDKVDIHNAYSLLETIAQKTGCEHIGALVGFGKELSFLGPIGLLMEHSPDVNAALTVMIENQSIQQNQIKGHLEVYGENASFILTPCEHSNRDGAKYFIEGAVFAVLSIIQRLVGQDFRVDQITFAHPPPKETKEYRRLAKAKVRFSQEQNAIVFSKDYLLRQRTKPNEELSQALTNYLALLREGSSNDLLTHLDFTIEQLLRNGICTLELAAAELHLHPRNLQRQLKAMGTSFRDILSAYRSRRADELLRDPNLQITQIALRLGYSDSTAFGQAFKKWFDKMPRDYRKQLSKKR